MSTLVFLCVGKCMAAVLSLWFSSNVVYNFYSLLLNLFRQIYFSSGVVTKLVLSPFMLIVSPFTSHSLLCLISFDHPITLVLSSPFLLFICFLLSFLSSFLSSHKASFIVLILPCSRSLGVFYLQFSQFTLPLSFLLFCPAASASPSSLSFPSFSIYCHSLNFPIFALFLSAVVCLSSPCPPVLPCPTGAVVCLVIMALPQSVPNGVKNRRLSWHR